MSLKQLIPMILGGASTIGQFQRGLQERQNIADTHRNNMKMAEYSYSKDLEMWNRMNQYNTPASQMERFREAGLNPNLIYSRGNEGNAGNMPQYNAPTFDFNKRKPLVDLGGVLNMYQDLSMKQAQIDNVKEQTEAVAIQNRLNDFFAYGDRYRRQQRESRQLYSGQYSTQFLNMENERRKQVVNSIKEDVLWKTLRRYSIGGIQRMGIKLLSEIIPDDVLNYGVLNKYRK